jgi:hypothetical protein
VRLRLTFDGDLNDYSATQIATLKDALSARLNCTAPACLMTLRLSAASVLLSMDLTIPNNGPGNPSAAVAQVNAAANVLAATPMTTLSAQLSAATGTQVDVIGIISVSVATGVLVPLVVAPPPPSPPPPSPSLPPPSNPPLLAVETSGSIGIIIGVIVGVVIALVLALVFKRRRRHLNEKRRKNDGLQVPNGQPAGLQVPNGREAQQDKKKGAVAPKAEAESADEIVAPEPKPTGATKAPVAPKRALTVGEGFELQNTPLMSSFMGMFSPKPEAVQNV